MTLRISKASLVLVKVPIAFKVNGAAASPTGYPVQLAYTANESTPPTVWGTGSWETAGAIFLARILTGPGGTVTPAVGFWTIWVQVTATPEIPAIPWTDWQVEIF